MYTVKETCFYLGEGENEDVLWAKDVLNPLTPLRLEVGIGYAELDFVRPKSDMSKTLRPTTYHMLTF